MTAHGNDLRPEQPEAESHQIEPIIVDLGRRPNKQLKKLKKGQGKLWEEVKEVIAETRLQLGADLDGKALLPLVILYRKKSKRRAASVLLPIPRI